MLVLSRKTGQRAVIAGSIHVVVLGVRGDRVRLGFEAPADVPIHREEVLERIMQETAVSESAGRREDDGQRVRERPRGVADVDSCSHHVAGAVPIAR